MRTFIIKKLMYIHWETNVYTGRTSMAEITIFSTPTCGYCKLAKEYFDKNDVSYTDIDVSVDQEKAKEMVEKTGQMGVPVIIVDNDGKEEVIVGFDQARLEELIAK